jgi:small subunit ribosomal protein S7
MAPRLNLLSTSRALTIRSRPQIFHEALRQSTINSPIARFSSHKDSEQPPQESNAEAIPSISEETAAIDKIKGTQPPELDQGTPVQDIIKRDKEAQKTAPKVIKDELKAQEAANGGKRSFSTTSKYDQDMAEGNLSAIQEDSLLSMLPEIWEEQPLTPLRPEQTLPNRYPAILEQFVNLIMQHGKKARAQTVRITRYNRFFTFY